MKKVFISIIAFIVALSFLTLAYATNNETGYSLEIGFTGESNITPETTNVVCTINMGNFSGIPEDALMGYEATLEYDENAFSTVSVKGLNGWTGSYADATKALTVELNAPGTATQNTPICQITFTLKENIELGTKTIKLKNGTMIIGATSLGEETLESHFEKQLQITVRETTGNEGQDGNGATEGDGQGGNGATEGDGQGGNGATEGDGQGGNGATEGDGQGGNGTTEGNGQGGNGTTEGDGQGGNGTIEGAGQDENGETEGEEQGANGTVIGDKDKNPNDTPKVEKKEEEIKPKQDDETITPKKDLPKTGIGAISFIIIMLSIVGITSFLRYKTIQIK